MKRRGFLAGLLAAPLLPHLPVPAEELNPCAELIIHSGDRVVIDFETYCTADVAGLDNTMFSWAFNTGRVVQYKFPNHPVIPTKTARFCNGRG